MPHKRPDFPSQQPDGREARRAGPSAVRRLVGKASASLKIPRVSKGAHPFGGFLWSFLWPNKERTTFPAKTGRAPRSGVRPGAIPSSSRQSPAQRVCRERGATDKRAERKRKRPRSGVRPGATLCYRFITSSVKILQRKIPRATMHMLLGAEPPSPALFHWYHHLQEEM